MPVVTFCTNLRPVTGLPRFRFSIRWENGIIMMKYDSLFLQWIIFRQKPKIGGANMKNKEADTELESRLLEILVHPCRIEDIRRELPECRQKQSQKRAGCARCGRQGDEKQEKPLCGLRALRLCGPEPIWLPSGHSRLSRRIIRRAKPSRMICSSRRMRPAVRGTATACSSR